MLHSQSSALHSTPSLRISTKVPVSMEAIASTSQWPRWRRSPARRVAVFSSRCRLRFSVSDAVSVSGTPSDADADWARTRSPRSSFANVRSEPRIVPAIVAPERSRRAGHFFTWASARVGILQRERSAQRNNARVLVAAPGFPKCSSYATATCSINSTSSALFEDIALNSRVHSSSQ